MVDCPFWLEVETAARAAGMQDFMLGDFRLRFSKPGLAHRMLTGSLRSTLAEDMRDAALKLFPAHERSLRELGQRNREFANIVLDVTAKRVFVEASKEAMRLRYLHRYLGMDLRAVHLMRDVRGVVSSSRRRQRRRVDVGAAAKAWLGLMRRSCAISRSWMQAIGLWCGMKTFVVTPRNHGGVVPILRR